MNPAITIIVDQTCSALAGRLRALAPVYVFTRADGIRTRPDRAADELREALRTHQQRGHFLLVAASFAGFTALLFAHRHPEEVAGLVLVDSSHPRQSQELTAAIPESEFERPGIAAFREFLRGFGPAWDESCQLLTPLEPLGDVPLIVLAADMPPMPESLSPATRRRLREIWHGLQEEHARRSRRGEMRVVPGAGHAIVADAPEVVIAAVTALLKTRNE